MKYDKIYLTEHITFILLASFISAIGVNAFFTPHKLLSGGVGGIALTIQYLSKIPAGYSVILINIPLFILSIREVDRNFTLLSFVGMFSQSVFLIITKDFSRYFMLKDILLSCIYGGVVHGAAMGAIFSNHGSLGGTDIISIIARKKYEIDIAKVSFGMNLFIVFIGALFFGVETGLYTLISMYIGANVMDSIIRGLDRKKLLLVVTEKEEEITSRIMTQIKRTSTVWDAEGSYSRQKKKALYCVVSLTQVPKLKNIIKSADPDSFVIILDAAEVQGKGFKTIV